MIELLNIQKSFKQEMVVKGVSFSLPSKGLVAIVGPSGSGKTTILNIIGGLINDYSGVVIFDKTPMSKFSSEELDCFRLTNIGFIYQSFNLFQLETVLENVSLPLKMSNDTSNRFIKKKVMDVLVLLGLEKKTKTIVANLSGGEKQRVAIARAIVSHPKLLLCDEPTGSLDDKNKENIMSILYRLSSESLIVVVSHDLSLMEKYVSRIITIDDGLVTSDRNIRPINENDKLIIPKTRPKFNKISLPFSFVFSHFKSIIKEKKWRTIFSNFVTSLALLGVGASITLISSVSNQIIASYSNIIESNKIVMSLKDNDGHGFNGRYSGSLLEANDIYQKYPEFIKGVGVYYQVNYENFFHDVNGFYIYSTAYRIPLDKYSVRHINEFVRINEEEDLVIYPHSFEKLEKDELVLSLSYLEMREICYQLRIQRDYKSLGDYLVSNNVLIALELANYEWEYEDEQLFRFVGVVASETPLFYHTNPMWNSLIFEEQMRFPTTESIDEVSPYPWVMKKIPYFSVYDKQLFLNHALYDIRFSPYILEPMTKNDYLFLSKTNFYEQRVLFFYYDKNAVDLSMADLLLKVEPRVKNYTIGSSGGYAIYPSSMMIGFAKETFFASSEESIENIIDSYTSLSSDVNTNFVLPQDSLSGHYTKSIANGVNYCSVKNKKVDGKIPSLINEIAISTNMAEALFSGVNPIGMNIHVARIANEYIDSSGKIVRKFDRATIKVTGLVNSEKNLVYHDEKWTISFFRDLFNVSAFDLIPNALILEIDNQNNSLSVITNLEKIFPKYSFVNPMSEISKSISEVCSYIEIALILFSSIAVITSILLLSVVSYLNVYDSKKDIGILRVIGASKKETRKMFLLQSVFFGFISFIFSSIELLGLSIFTNYALANATNSSFLFSFNPFAIVIMFCVSLVVSLLSGLYATRKIKKYEILSLLK